MESSPSSSALVHCARRLFTEQGYAAVSVNEIAAAAGVTKGAVYYQFADKKDLFRAACQMILAEMVEKVTGHTMDHIDHVVDEIVTGGDALFHLYEAKDARQLLLIDGPAVLGLAEWTKLHKRLRVDLAEHALHHLADADLIDRATVPMLAHLLFGAFTQGVLQIVASSDPETTSREARAAYRTLATALLNRPANLL
jgi:AcrR family transcriptional regulator